MGKGCLELESESKVEKIEKVVIDFEWKDGKNEGTFRGFKNQKRTGRKIGCGAFGGLASSQGPFRRES